MGELQLDIIDTAQGDMVPLEKSDPKLWQKMGPKLRETIAKSEQGAGIRTAPGQQLSPQAEAERQAIYQDHLYLTPSQVEALDMEAYKKWSELGSHMKPEPLTPEQEAEQTRLAEARTAEMQLLENADDESYRQIRAEQDALYAQQAHEVITH
jgi:hypothetical protein